MQSLNRTPPWRRRTPAGAALFLLLAVSPAFACEACNQRMIASLLGAGGAAPSLHADEMRGLMAGFNGLGPRTGLFSAPGLGAATALAAAPAATPAPAPAPAAAAPATAGPHPFADIIERDRKLPIPETSYVVPGTKPDKKFTLIMEEGDVPLGNGVIYRGFNVNGTVPGPMLVMDEGDVVELSVLNQGSVPHGVSLHAVYTQTSKYYGKINPGQTRTHTFRVNHPGVYMYHCAPGGHAIPMHTLIGQYGMMVVRPKKLKYKMDEVMGRGPDVELFLVQHELYANGKDAVEGRPAYVMFNGSLFRYVADPIKVRPGDFVRIHFLNVGPNIVSTFHIVGIIWDYAYWQGMPNPENTLVGGQSVLAGPTDSWVVDFRVPPDEGNYLIVTHAFGSATRGAIGVLAAAKDQERTPAVIATGPSYPKDELEKLTAKAVRIIAPTEPGTDDLAYPARLGPGETTMRVSIIGNSFWPKVVEVPAGTTVEWTNEDVFTYAQGEFAGIHDVQSYEGPDKFVSKMLGHGEKFSVKLDQKGEYKYLCTPHPYMEGIVRVK